MRKTLLLAVALVGALGAVGVADAQTSPGPAVTVPATTMIAARKAGFGLQAATVIGMKAAIDAGLDVKGFADGSKSLSGWGRVIPLMFPDGTQTGGETRARPEIWSDSAGFRASAERFWTAADKLATLAEANDKAGFAAQYTVTTQACGACHRAYQVRN
ncbi:MAG: cytochrome c [Gemmatimonadaceae bacterium]|nr:cytochrome c [Acetobacteraceae bacterium]